MDDKQLQSLKQKLYSLTPTLTNDLLESFQVEPQLLATYDQVALRGMAEQGVVSFRDIVLGALEFNAPGLVTHELSWLDRMLHSRKIESDRVHIFLDIFRNRLKSDLAKEESAPLLEILDAAQLRLDAKKK